MVKCQKYSLFTPNLLKTRKFNFLAINYLPHAYVHSWLLTEACRQVLEDW